MFNHIKKRRSAQATQAATLIVIIGILIIFYILFLPEETRQELLGDEDDYKNGAGKEKEEEIRLLLDETPGILLSHKRDEYEYKLSSVTLYSTEEGKQIERFNPFLVKRTYLANGPHSFSFILDNPQAYDNLLLSFDVKEGKGALRITLNDNVIFEGEIAPGNSPPISLRKGYLQKENKIVFESEKVGLLSFLSKNFYEITNTKIFADVTDFSQQSSRISFFITPSQYENIETSRLEYVPECDVKRVGPLVIDINGVEIFSGLPDCGIINVVHFSPNYLNKGSNELGLQSDRGRYLIDLIKIKTQLKEPVYPVYYFNLNQSEYEDVRFNQSEINLSLEFIDDLEYKEAKLVINGIEVGFYQKERLYSRIIDSYIQEGNNALKIIPKTRLEIINLKLTLQKE